MFGETWWTVRIDNASGAVITMLGVDVAALDTNGFEVPHGCSRAAGMVPVDQVFDRSIRAALYDMSRGRFEHERCPRSSKQYVTRWWVTLSMNGHAPCRQMSTP